MRLTVLPWSQFVSKTGALALPVGLGVGLFVGLVTVLPLGVARSENAQGTRSDFFANAPVSPTHFVGDLRELSETSGPSALVRPRAFPPSRQTPRDRHPAVPIPDSLVELQDESDPLDDRALSLVRVTVLDRQTRLVPTHVVRAVGIHYIAEIADGTLTLIDKDSTDLVVSFVDLSVLWNDRCRPERAQVAYDRWEHRWIVAGVSERNARRLCVAVSQSADPVAGGWFAYRFTASDPLSHPVLAVWPRAVYVTTKSGDASLVVALDRPRLIAGEPSLPLSWRVRGRLQLYPVPFEGRAPTSTDGILYRLQDVHRASSRDRIELMEIRLADARLTRSVEYELTPLESVLSHQETSLLPHVRYRQFETYGALFGTVIVDADGQGREGVRWFEMRRDPQSWRLVQEGTYAVGGEHRFQSQLAMDSNGNLALGHATEGADGVSSIRYSGRRKDDPPGVMTRGETIVGSSLMSSPPANGASSHLPSHLSIETDPADECTFWIADERADAGWQSVWGRFAFASCRQVAKPTDANRVTRNLADIDPLAKAAPALCSGLDENAHEVVVRDTDEFFTVEITNPCPQDVIGRMEVIEVTASTDSPYPDFSAPRNPILFSLGIGETAQADFQIFAKPELTHQQFEILARDVAYRKHWVPYRLRNDKGAWMPPSQNDHLDEWFERPEQTVAYPQFDYWVDMVVDDRNTGFYGLGLRADKLFVVTFSFKDIFGNELLAGQNDEVRIYYETRPPTLVLRGTEPLTIRKDIFSDGHPMGVGFNQFAWNRDEVEKWLMEVSATAMAKSDLRPNITGHSLGAALAQLFALNHADKFGPRLGQIVTFNSPGITPSAVVRNITLDGTECLDPFHMPFDWAKSVTHYIIKGDLVSMAGNCYLPAPDLFNDHKPNWVQYAYTGADSLLKYILDMHTRPVLTTIEGAGSRPADISEPRNYQDIYEVGVFEEPPNGYGTSLSEPCFSYLRHGQYIGLMQVLGRAAGLAGPPGIGGEIARALAFRTTVEASRQSIGNVIWEDPNIDRPGFFGAINRASNVWPPDALKTLEEINRRAEPCRALLDATGTPNKASLTLATSTNGGGDEPASAEEAWTAMLRWPVDAWQASASWPAEAWIAIRFWPASRWEETTKLTALQWQQTAFHFPDEWLERPGFFIAGTVFRDADGNGSLAGESGLANAVVFLEKGAGDGVRQTDEPYDSTSSSGGYTLHVTSAGTYTVRVQLPASGWKVTFPQSGGHPVTIVENQPNREINGLDFGLYCPTCGGGGDNNVDPAPRSDTLPITSDSFLRTFYGIRQGVETDTGIPFADYVCAVGGSQSTGGNINQGYDYVGTLTEVQVFPGNKTWHMRANFRTHGTHERWDRIQVLCFRRSIATYGDPDPAKPVFVKVFGNSPNFPVSEETDIPTSQYACGVAGYLSIGGDIQERGTGTIQETILDGSGPTWRIRRSFHTERYGTSFVRVAVVCTDRKLTALGSPLPGRPYFFQRFPDLGSDVNFDTKIASEDWVCTPHGFVIKDGDIDEYGKPDGVNLVSVYTEATNGTWRIRAGFRTHSNHESWDVDLLCAAKGGVPPGTLNTSQLSKGSRDCLGDNYRCQTLMDELIDPQWLGGSSGPVRLVGGGYTGSPSFSGKRCSNLNQIEVYVNDRHPDTGEPKWSRPNFCVSPGGSFTYSPNNTYDLRSASLIGAEPLPFQLVANDAPVMAAPSPADFPAPYGPGIRLSWSPSTNPRATYHEIQFATPGGAWQVYNAQRPVHHGGWINHHGNVAYLDIQKALPPAATYRYRVRVLDVGGNAISGWSNEVSGTVRDWNQSPKFAFIRDQNVRVGQTLFFDVSVSDPEGMNLQFEVLDLPAGAGFSPSTPSPGKAGGRVGFMPQRFQVGTWEARFRATDPFGKTTTQTVYISVCDGSDTFDCF